MARYALDHQIFSLPENEDPVLGIMSAELSLVLLCS